MSLLAIECSKKFSDFFDKKDEKREIRFLVLHHVEANSADHAIEQFNHHQVSSHFLIDESGKIFELVDENDIAYHAGISYWRGVDGLNKNSIGIEFINSAPFSKKFSHAQMLSGVELARYLLEKYEIEQRDVVGHSDIGYVKESGFLDRKQDPSHLFDWKFLAQNGVGIFPEITLSDKEEKELHKLGNKGQGVEMIKQNLKNFGYKVKNLNGEFDEEMQALVRVFNRRFLGKDSDIWFLSSHRVLEALIGDEKLRPVGDGTIGR